MIHLYFRNQKTKIQYNPYGLQKKGIQGGGPRLFWTYVGTLRLLGFCPCSTPTSGSTDARRIQRHFAAIFHGDRPRNGRLFYWGLSIGTVWYQKNGHPILAHFRSLLLTFSTRNWVTLWLVLWISNFLGPGSHCRFSIVQHTGRTTCRSSTKRNGTDTRHLYGICDFHRKYSIVKCTGQ